MPLSVPTRDFARQLRHNSTDAERRLWRHLRGRRLQGLKFRRQHPIGPYFADFACLELGLVIELDGGQHNDERGRYRDSVRADVLASHNFTVIRFWDNDVLRDTSAVLSEIVRTVAAVAQPSPQPSPARGRGSQTLTPALSRSRERESDPRPNPLPLAGEGVRPSPQPSPARGRGSKTLTPTLSRKRERE